LISWYRKGLSKSIIIALICKRKRNQQILSEEEEKEYNKIHSKKRIVIENTILGEEISDYGLHIQK
jgi:hypothetical protein